jgi:heme/copper-type cytochrome/quinol oxidase subunit 2
VICFWGSAGRFGRVAAKIDLMTTLCSAFGVFSAFGAAILVFLTTGGGLGRLSGWVAKHENQWWGDAFVWLVAGAVALAVIISGLGLFTSFFWLRAVANGSGHASRWAYTFADNMFFTEAVVVTVITVVAVIGTAIAALPGGKGSDTSNQPAPVGQAAES